MNPPPLARWLISRLAPPEDRDIIVGDLDEEFRQRASAAPRSAAAWYWRQTLASLPPALRLRWRRAAVFTNVGSDVRYALRGARRHRAFTAAAIVTIALGAGTTTAVVSVIDAVLFRTLPYSHADGIFMLGESGSAGSRTSWPDFLELSQRTRSFAAMAGFDGISRTLTGAGPADRLGGVAVTSRFFDVLGVTPALGRGFTDADASPSAPPVVLLSHAAWTRRFGADAAILGQTIALSGQPYTVIGVLPATFVFPQRGGAEIWIPLLPTKDQRERPYFHWLDIVVTLRPGVTPAAAAAELRGLSQDWNRRDAWHASTVLRAVSIRDDIVSGVRPALLVLGGAALLLLLAAAASVSALIVSRAAGRARELAVRVSMGATRVRMARQMLVESLCLATMGIVPGVLLGAWAVAIFGAGVPLRYRLRIPSLDHLTVSPVAAASAVLLTTFAIVGAGLASVGGGRGAANISVMLTGVRATGSRREARLRRLLVATQIALAVALLAGAALIARSVMKLTQVSPGFDTARLLAAQISLPRPSYPTPAAVASMTDRILDRIRAIPGVTGAEEIDQLPLTGSGSYGAFSIPGVPDPVGTQRETLIRTISTGYFHLMAVPVVAGRTFAASDGGNAARVVVVSDTFARRYFADGALGRRIVFQLFDGMPEWTIVGVVGDQQFNDVDKPMAPVVYFPFAQNVTPAMSLVVRTVMPPEQVAASVRAAVASLDSNLPVFALRSMERSVSDSAAMFLRVLVARLLAWFSFAALILAGVGVYGMLAQSIAAKTREIGVRAALGATRSAIARLVVVAGLVPAIWGLLAGAVVVALIAPALRALLFGVTALDPPALAAVTLVIGVVALLACAVPAWRAVRLPVTTALRQE